jgi:hypothetical protein
MHDSDARTLLNSLAPKMAVSQEEGPISGRRRVLLIGRPPSYELVRNVSHQRHLLQPLLEPNEVLQSTYRKRTRYTVLDLYRRHFEGHHIPSWTCTGVCERRGEAQVQPQRPTTLRATCPPRIGHEHRCQSGRARKHRTWRTRPAPAWHTMCSIYAQVACVRAIPRAGGAHSPWSPSPEPPALQARQVALPRTRPLCIAHRRPWRTPSGWRPCVSCQSHDKSWGEPEQQWKHEPAMLKG